MTNNILKDRFRTLEGAYFGVREIDEYDLKAYTLKRINEYIKIFLKENVIDFSYEKEKQDVEDNVELKVKLQDALLILNELNEDKELLALIKKRIRKIEKEMNL